MAKTQEQRVKDAAAYLSAAGWPVVRSEDSMQAMAASVLEAADREPPVWPTEESIAAFLTGTAARAGGLNTLIQNGLRQAMLEDPIIKAAIQVCRDNNNRLIPVGSLRTVYEAVRDAGLLEGER